MAAKQKLLEIGAADGRLREIPLMGDEFLIGRGEDCDLPLHDPEVSRHHCLIRIRHQEVAISDLGSSNGTFVNGHRLVSQVKLATGDEIVIGPFRYVVDLGDVTDFQPPGIDSQAMTRTIKDVKKRLAEESRHELS
jgi:pSer/pThr/pTyr-binding forkhead associated (FHA) protein